MKKDAEKKIEMMNEDSYWEIIESSLEHSNDMDEQFKYLVKNLSERTPDEIVGFMLRTHELQQGLYTPQIWCAGFLMNKGYCSDDGFEYYRSWIISRGKVTYYKAKDNPDSLVNKIDNRVKFYDFEKFSYIASYAFEQKAAGKDIYLRLNEKLYRPNHRKINFNWHPDKPRTMQVICPEIFEKMWSESLHSKNTISFSRLQQQKRKPGGHSL